MKLILGTGNVMSSGHSVVQRHLFAKSNVELINGLRSNITVHRDRIQPTSEDSYKHWTNEEDDTLYIPSWRPTPLAEPRSSYDITVKLFFLPGIPASRRCEHTKEAIKLVLNELAVDSVDLLIISYPGVSFDAEDEIEEDSPDENESTNSEESEGIEAQLRSWRVLEDLFEQGTIKQLGLAEFSSDRLGKFLPQVKIRPTVDQINVKDCCVVPKDLILYAKEHKIDLLTHNDCTDILPGGTTRELLGPGTRSANIIAARPDAGENEPGLKGDIEPQWVIKYTAVVKDRGVVENKGYIAAAQLGTCIETR
jgi:glutamate--cysteine ligase regulatory subunit